MSSSPGRESGCMLLSLGGGCYAWLGTGTILACGPQCPCQGHKQGACSWQTFTTPKSASACHLGAGRKKRRATRGSADAEFLPGGNTANLLPTIEDPMRALVSWSPSGGQPGQPGATQPPSQQQVQGNHLHTLRYFIHLMLSPLVTRCAGVS